MQVILNTRSGRNRKASELEAEIRRKLSASDSLVRVDAGTSIQSIAGQATEARESFVVACGGDGTVNAVAAMLVKTDCRLGIIPTETLNHFARDLGNQWIWLRRFEPFVRVAPAQSMSPRSMIASS